MIALQKIRSKLKTCFEPFRSSYIHHISHMLWGGDPDQIQGKNSCHAHVIIV